MSKIDFSAVIKDLEDKPVSEPIYGDEIDDDGNKKVIDTKLMTLGSMSKSALLNLSENDKNVLGQEKFDRCIIAEKIQKSFKKNEPVNLTSEEITLIKKLIGDMFFPLYVMKAWRLLEKEDE
jgi:hypothetical protein